MPSCAPCRISCSCRRRWGLSRLPRVRSRQLLLHPEQFLGKNMREVCRRLAPHFEPAFAQAPAPRGQSSLWSSSTTWICRKGIGGSRLGWCAATTTRYSPWCVTSPSRHDRGRSSRERAALRPGDGRRRRRRLGLELRDQRALRRPQAEIASGIRRRGDHNPPGGLGIASASPRLPAAAARVKACIDGDTDVYEVEHRMLHKDGSVGGSSRADRR